MKAIWKKVHQEGSTTRSQVAGNSTFSLYLNANIKYNRGRILQAVLPLLCLSRPTRCQWHCHPCMWLSPTPTTSGPQQVSFPCQDVNDFTESCLFPSLAKAFIWVFTEVWEKAEPDGFDYQLLQVGTDPAEYLTWRENCMCWQWDIARLELIQLWDKSQKKQTKETINLLSYLLYRKINIYSVWMTWFCSSNQMSCTLDLNIVTMLLDRYSHHADPFFYFLLQDHN